MLLGETTPQVQAGHIGRKAPGGERIEGRHPAAGRLQQFCGFGVPEGECGTRGHGDDRTPRYRFDLCGGIPGIDGQVRGPTGDRGDGVEVEVCGDELTGLLHDADRVTLLVGRDQSQVA